MAKIFEYFKRGIRYVLSGQPIVVTKSDIVTLTNDNLLIGNNVIVTGGTSGIGYEIAKSCLRAGANVVITSRDEEKARKIAANINQELSVSTKCHGIGLDTMKVERFSEIIDLCTDIFGGQPVNMLVNNAGISGGEGDLITEFDHVIGSNLRGTYALSVLFAEYFKAHKIHGHILNIGSASGLRPAITPYMLSKWGIRGLTLGLAKKYIADGIVVNGIAPGPTATQMIKRSKEDITNSSNPAGRLVLPEEIASMAVILLSDLGKSIIGDMIYMTGGAGLITFDDVKY